MKKIVALFASVACTLLLQAQTVEKFGTADTYRTAVCSTADSILGTAEVGKIFKVDKPYSYDYQYQMKAHNVVKDGNVTFTTYGSLDGTYYKSLDTIVWKVTTADTVVIFDNSTTQVKWIYLKGTIKGASAGNRTSLTGEALKIAD